MHLSSFKKSKQTAIANIKASNSTLKNQLYDAKNRAATLQEMATDLEQYLWTLLIYDTNYENGQGHRGNQGCKFFTKTEPQGQYSNNYCWTHDGNVGNDHTSMTCGYPSNVQKKISIQ